MNNTVSSGLLEGVQNILRADSITEMHDDELAISKKVKINNTSSIYTIHTVL